MTYYMVMIDDDDVTMVNRYVMHPTRWGIAFPPTTAPPYEERGREVVIDLQNGSRRYD